jgi:Ca2+-binding EF-hand superfamily protein
MRTITMSAIAAALLLTAGAPIAEAKDKKADAKPKLCAAIKAVDPDNDGKFDLAEAKKAAEKLFDKLNKDGDKTLELKEFKGRVSKKDFEAANPDKDGSLDKAEYLALVEKRFNEANPDKDGTLECKELGSAKGQAVMKLLK